MIPLDCQNLKYIWFGQTGFKDRTRELDRKFEFEAYYQFLIYMIGELGRTTGMLLAWFRESKLIVSTLIAKILFPGKIDQVGVNGGSIYDKAKS